MTAYAVRTWSDRRCSSAIRELFNAWRQAEHDASIGLARWRGAEDGAKGDAHAAHLAALDREARAAEVLRQRVELR